jgi:tetratricopeptide (TPR) repeat protein
LSHEQVTINPAIYIEQRRKNQDHIQQFRVIDDILAVVSYKMKITQNFSPRENPVTPLLQKTLNEISKDKELKKSPQLRFKIYHAVSRILLQKREYKALEEYLLVIFKEFETEKLFSKSNHDTKLQMLVFIVNTLFKNGKLKESLKYTEKLKVSMEEYQRLFYDKYLFFYYNSLVINYSKLDGKKAIEILEEMKTNVRLKATPFYEMFVYANLAVLFFDQKNYHQSIRNLNKVYLLDGFKNADRALQFKISIAELMIRYELQDYDILEIKISQVKKDYREFLKKKETEREKQMLTIIRRMIETDNIRKDKILYSNIQSVLNAEEKQAEGDAEVINYKSWLREKIS